MPTSRPRHAITETETVARALEDAARRWPEEASPSRLLLRLVAEGHRSMLAEREHERQAHETVIRRTSGVLSGAFGSGYLEALRDDWPA